jgi:glycerol-3-phosphate acyltransferase PlsY
MLVVKWLLAFVIAYLIGGINFSIVFSKLFKKQDIRTMGSGNAGFTNTLRSYGKGMAALVFVCDIAKAFLAAGVAKLISSDPYTLYLAGLGVILGHNFPIYYGLKGGKGILTTITVLTIVDWRAGFVCIPLALAIIFLTGYVSLGSLFICLYFPISIMILHWGDIPMIVFAWIICILGFFMHRGNIKRLLSGTERRFGKRRKQNG